MEFFIRDDGTNLGWGIKSGGSYSTLGTNTYATAAERPTYLRIRFDGGQTCFDTSLDGTSWNELDCDSYVLAGDHAHVLFGQWTANTGGVTTTMTVDDVVVTAN